MKPMRIFEIRWKGGQKVEVYHLRAASRDDAQRAFNRYSLPGVSILSIKLVDEPDDGVAPAARPSPIAPLSPGALNGLPSEFRVPPAC